MGVLGCSLFGTPEVQVSCSHLLVVNWKNLGFFELLSKLCWGLGLKGKAEHLN